MTIEVGSLGIDLLDLLQISRSNFIKNSVTNFINPNADDYTKVAAFRSQLLKQNWIEKHLLLMREVTVLANVCIAIVEFLIPFLFCYFDNEE